MHLVIRAALLLPLSIVACGPVGSVDLAPEPPAEEACGGEPCYARVAAPRVPINAGRPGDGVQLIDYGVQKQASDASWGAVLTDIETHLPSSYGTQYQDADKITHGHETTHGINSDIRNNRAGGIGKNGFYLLGSKGVILDEPNMRKSAVAQYVPRSLQGSRYNLYIVGQTAWDDMPTYVFDEWVAYANGSAVGIDLVERGLWRYGWRDGVAGTLEFVVYGLATAMAVEARAPQYWASNTQFREFVAWHARRSMQLFRKGAGMNDFKYDVQDRYYESLKSSADAEAMRAFIKRVYGQQYYDEVILGIEIPGGGGAGGAGGTGGAGGSGGMAGAGGAGGMAGAGGAGGMAGAGGGGGGGGGAGGDADGDGIRDADDLCGRTPRGAPVWTYGEWKGCAEGQYRDRPPGVGSDADGDGVPDAQDLCSNSPRGQPVWRSGEWTGCAGGQYRDRDVF